MLSKFEYNNEFETEVKNLSRYNRPAICEGSNNVSILKLGKSSYSIKKEDLDGIKLYFDLNNIEYDIVEFKYNKYSKILEKRARNSEVWFFQDFGIYGDTYITLYNFKTNMIQNKDEEDYFVDEIYAAAQKLGYRIHLNERPECWNKYSNGLY